MLTTVAMIRAKRAAIAIVPTLERSAFVVATVENIFVANSALYWITTYAGVIIFSALTAYDMQKLKQIQSQGVTGDDASRLAIFGALSLYLDFINLFLFLLRIFGQRR